MELDLDAKRAARAEAEAEPKTVILGAQSFTLPTELPFRIAELWTTGDLSGGLKLLLSDQIEAFWTTNPSAQDIQALVEGIVEMYGLGELGESSASGGPSRPTGRRSRRTSSVSTGSTSGKRASAKAG
jgi:hypothetical protein